MGQDPPNDLNRRAFGALTAAIALGGARRAAGRAPAVIAAEGARPAIPCGVASGDVTGRSAVVWARTDRPSRMVVEWSATASFQNARVVAGPAALPEDDYSARVVLTGLPPGQTISYRVTFRDLASPRSRSLPVEGSFRTAPAAGSDVTLAWGGDTAGQGWGIDPARGGMAIYESIRNARPDVFLHSGDHIYADNPILAEVPLDDGTVWRNLVTEATSKVAETLDEFRGRYRYNTMDDNLRRLYAEVPVLSQWDDHEVLNNWYPGEVLADDPRYTVKSVDLLAARARRAFFESTPIRPGALGLDRVYRSVRYGPNLEVFLLDQRTYRGPNTANTQAARGPDTAFLGPEQLRWLKARLKASTATWKIIASDMPIGLVVKDGPATFEAAANADPGPPLGRELEIADLLRFLKTQKIRNVAWLTADVHYAAAHRYDPSRATFTEFDPFWEFVAGPLHAGTFGPGALDPTFGPAEVFRSIPEGMKPNRPPSDGLQFFGLARVDGKAAALTVSLHDRAGTSLYSVELPPEQ